MRAPVVLATTHHDPNDAMLPQAQCVLPCLHELYDDIVVLATATTGRRTIETLRGMEVYVEVEKTHERVGLEIVGLARRDVVGHAIDLGAESVHLCDWDRILHWADAYPNELSGVVTAIPDYDLLILGRTSRALATHPRVQRDTEAIVNHVFGLAFGQQLDVTAASRGLSRRAVRELLELDAPETTIGNDCAWPLYLARFEQLSIGYVATEGLEWETPDRYVDEIAAASGLDSWVANYDADPQHWEFRLQLALHEVAAINRWRVR
jgi:hypothetical protein